MKIAYCMSRFPLLSETAIIWEMDQMKKDGFEIEVFPLILEKPKVMHKEAVEFMKVVHHRSPFSWHVFGQNIKWMIRSPKVYFSTLFRVLWENRTDRKFLVHSMAAFFQAVDQINTIRQIGVNHLHAHFPTFSGVFVWTVWRFTGITYSLSVHAHDLYVRHEMLETKYKSALFIRTISEFNKRYILTHFPSINPENIYVIQCGVEIADFPKSNQRAPLEKRLDIVSIGSLQPYKGQIYLISACAILKEKGVPFALHLLGGGELFDSLTKEVKTLGLDQQVFIEGAVPRERLVAALSEANCYIQPSIITSTGKMEGVPASIMEAAAARLPVITTDISGLKELVIPGECGLLVKEKDASALAEALITFHQNPKEAARFATNLEIHVREDYSIEKNCQKLAALYREKL